MKNARATREKNQRSDEKVKQDSSNRERTYHNSTAFSQKKRQASIQSRMRFQENMKNPVFAVENFKSLCEEQPIYACKVCQCYKFNAQVANFKLSAYHNKIKKACMIASAYADADQKQFICKTCHQKILKGCKPPTAFDNSLKPKDMQSEFRNLNTLEEQLVSPVIPFVEIVSLHKTKQSIHGPAICVPANIETTATTLP